MFKNPKKRKYQTKIALKNSDSEQKLLQEEHIELIQPSITSISSLSSQQTELIIHYLNRLLTFDEKVGKLANEINQAEILEKFLEFQFGLESNEKAELERLISGIISQRRGP